MTESTPINEASVFSIIANTEDLKTALLRHAVPDSAFPRDEKLGRLLIERGLISDTQQEQALALQRKQPNSRFGEILVRLGAISQRDLLFTIAQKMGVPFVDLREFETDTEVAMLVPVDIMRRYKVLPLIVHQAHLVVAVSDPAQHDALDVMRFISNRSIEIVLATAKDITDTLKRFYSSIDDSDDYFASAEDENDGWSVEKNTQELREAERLSKEKPIVRLVNGIIRDAIRRNASDIHIRPLEEQVDLMLRIDGVLLHIRSFSIGLLAAVVSRIKVIGHMNIAERRLPQDGQARFSYADNVVDFRISIIPTVNGESVVIRLLNRATGLRRLSHLGFNDHDLEKLTNQLNRSSGLVLVTGPTGSGKSTTLYAALQELRKRDISLISVEDPVEYHIDGINQIPINHHTGYNFSKALRHILRHDPDAIMIGEIRDQETARIAVESAMTGHLVLSSLHTNSAAGAINRLTQMHVEAYLVSASLRMVIAQRLVRSLCPHCKRHTELDDAVAQRFKLPVNAKLYSGHGCDSCDHTGYAGRQAAYEILVIDDTMQELIESGAGTLEIQKAAEKRGMVPFWKNALELALQGATSVEEVLRIQLG